MDKYVLLTKEDKPGFKFIVYSPNRPGFYWLYNTLYEALEKADVLSRSMRIHIHVAEPEFFEHTGQWYLVDYARMHNGEIFLEDCRRRLLHVHWYINAGYWQNPGEL